MLLTLGLMTCLVAVVSGVPTDDEFQKIDGLGFYKLYDPSKWAEAMTYCYLRGAHLAIINSEEEAIALKNLMANHSVPYYAHIGFSDLFKLDYYVTVNGDPLSKAGYTRWEGGLPSNRGWRCGALTATGELTNRNCDEILSFICEKDLWSEYSLVPGLGYYKLHDEPATWGEALKKCHLEGTTLAAVNSKSEASALLKIFEPSSSELSHIGVHDMYREAFYVTVEGDGIQESGYNNWTQYQPYKTTLLNNVAMDHSGLYHLMNNTVKLPFICEKHLEFPIAV